MEKEKKWLKSAGILKCIMSIVLFKYPLYAVIMLASGIFLYIESKENEEKIYENKLLIFLIGILTIFDLIGSIFIFMATYKLHSYKIRANGIKAPPKKDILKEKEKTKRDIIEKLGLLMILVAGVLLATSPAEFMSELGKCLSLVIIGVLFLIVAILTKNKFKLMQTSELYWLLSMAFILLSVIESIYYGLLGEYVALSGNALSMGYTIIFITICAEGLITFLVYDKKEPLFICYASFLCSLYNLLVYFGFRSIEIITLFTIITTIINVLSKKGSYLFDFSKIISYILLAFVVTEKYRENLLALFVSVISIININYLTFNKEADDESLINILITYGLIFFGLSDIFMIENLNIVLIALLSGLYTLLVNSYIVPIREKDIQVNYLAYSLIIAMCLFITYSNQSLVGPLLITISYIIISLIAKRGVFNTHKIDIAAYLEPVSIMGLFVATSTTLFRNIDLIYAVSLTIITYSFIHIKTKKQLTKNIYFISIITGLMITLLTNSASLDFVTAIISVVVALYLFIVALNNKKNTKTGKEYLVITSIFMLTSLYIPFVYRNLLNINIMLVALLFIVALLLLIMIMKDRTFTKISCLYIIFPLISVVSNTELSTLVGNILNSIILLYMSYIVIKLYIDNKILKNILGMICLILFTSGVFFETSIFAGVYVGIIGLIAIIIGLKDDDLFLIFITGIIYTIINIFYRFWMLWEKMPYWIYLLLGGLLLVAYVTYNEIKKDSQKK